MTRHSARTPIHRPATPCQDSTTQSGAARKRRRSVAVAYLNAMLESADQEELIATLGRIAEASGGPRLAEKVELNGATLYRTLCRRGNPELRSVLALLRAMGMRLTLQPIGDSGG